MQQSIKRLMRFLIITAIFAASSVAANVVTSTVGDIEIYIDDNVWKCDKIECPPETDHCRASKSKEKSNATSLIRSNVCYSQKNDVLKEKTIREPIDANENINVVVNASRKEASYQSSFTSSNSSSNIFSGSQGLGGFSFSGLDLGWLWG